jgi:NifU-like protein involved in Fe-S cluster formation
VSDFEQRVRQSLADPKNQGEMPDADRVGTVGSPECGDMVRLWLKFTEKNGRKVIDRASFQAFGCQTAIAVASMATELLRGKTPEEAGRLDASQLTGDLGPLPPMKIHCGQLVEEALRDALGEQPETGGAAGAAAATLGQSVAGRPGGRVRVVPLDPGADRDPQS